ncbi:MAG: AAA family ATPase [Flavobacteriales bacterium]
MEHTSISRAKFDSWLDAYKAYVQSPGYAELYKWQIAKTVQENWDLDQVDLAGMVDRSFIHRQQNLWSGHHYLPKVMLMKWAEQEPEEVRQALRDLLHGTAPLADRMRMFEKLAKNQLLKARPNEEVSPYQGMRAMALWLGMVLPQRHYLYKSSMVSGFCKQTGYPPLNKPGDKYTTIDSYYDLCEEVRTTLLARPDIIEAHRSIHDAGCYPDPEHHLLVQDFIYYVARLKELIRIDEVAAAFENRNDLMIDKHPLNTILYGPPGTGKTYHAISHAVAIIDGEDVEVVKKRDRKEVRKRYQELFDARLIRAVTFHQSFSYEDFVEGIKPKTIEGEDEEKPKQVTYDVEPGIFREICASARTGGSPGAGPHLTEDTLQKAKFYKVSLGQYNSPADDPIYAYCMEEGVIAVGYGGHVDVSSAKSETDIRQIISKAGFKEEDSERHTITVLRKMHLEMEVGDIVLISAGNSAVRAIGQVTGPYFVDLDAPIRFKQFRKVKWLYTDLELPVEDIYPIKFTMGSLYDLDRRKVKLDYFRTKRGTVSAKKERYVLIIDEINRGNVAGIFGELITLIESDKREGSDEALRLKLPYSKEDFSVPANLYLLGTMNTADRSVEALDTALRRRFSFVPMMPDTTDLKPLQNSRVDLHALLNKINERLIQFMDEDHQIGHSHFWELHKEQDPMPALRRVFAEKVIPQLEEYFHRDRARLRLVLGDAFVDKVIADEKLFNRDDDDIDFELRPTYRLRAQKNWSEGAFVAIYAKA